MAGSKPRNHAGRRFGRLVAVEMAGRTPQRSVLWACTCDCGNHCAVSADNLLTGNTRSCGCLADERRARFQPTHGQSSTRLHSLWCKVMERCYSASCRAFADYGGRGIVVAPEWHSFENFAADVGSRPLGTSLDRRDNDGPYSKENCRWATPTEQGRNKRTNRLLTLHGKTQCMSAWCEEFGLKAPTVSYRLNVYGWSVERALTTPVARRAAA